MHNNNNNIFCSKLNLNVKGNCIERFIKRLKNNKIQVLNIIYVSKTEINIKVYKYDYEKIMNLKTIYEIDILNYYGTAKIKDNILENKYVIVFILISLISLYIITNIIFSIDIVTNDSKMEYKIRNELNKLGIKKYKFKVGYDKLQIIKKKLLNKYINELEWVEIENIGTKYIIRYEPRIINNNIINSEFRNIISTKDAIIMNLSVSKGQIIKNTNSYVKKGEVIVSGQILLNNDIKGMVSATGTVYGETWYKVVVTYPFKYYKKTYTGKKKNIIVLKFLNKEYELFNFKRYKNKEVNNKEYLKNTILPIFIGIQNQREINIIDENNTKEEIITKALLLSESKIKKRLSTNEYIKNYKILSKSSNKDALTLNIFYSVVENIGKYQKIEE